MKKYNKIITKELNRILPYHLLAVVLHGIVIYITFKIPESIGKILDMLSQTNIDKGLNYTRSILVDILFYNYTYTKNNV